jgi:hypothetical protein
MSGIFKVWMRASKEWAEAESVPELESPQA